MDIKDQIENGIIAHGVWKMRIRRAITSGQSDWEPEVVRQDNQCEFGQWLYGLEDKSSPFFEDVKSLHAEFHKTAAAVLAMALAGNKDKAIAALNVGGKYDTISHALSEKLMEWKRQA
ncbi:CZB domain-containing protein [Kistimonas asteriae]|uniref:CZB domain-containing protein n=1 Tax=Kistimonas asteriae TaxID=517724 RepID=UPI001BAAB5D4|nr:CZB domain-containing protein [Kistimonas asteriae]